FSPLFHHRGEPVEEIERVVGAGGRLGVVLDAERATVPRGEPLARAVVEVDVRALDARGERREVDAEAVVLRRDLDAAGREILHRLVRAAMTELQLVRLAAEREREELVAEADPEDGLLPEELADG